MESKIFDIITSYSVNEGINKVLLEDEEYTGILCYNHLSAKAVPGEIRKISRCPDASKKQLLGIKLVDRIITGNFPYYNFLKKGIL